MRGQGTLVLPVLALIAAGSLRAEAPGAGPAVAACVERASADRKGLEALRADCPALEQALRDLKLDPFLPATWEERINTRQLADLNALTARYAQEAPRALADPGSLMEIARRLPHPASTVTPLDVLRRWFWSWLGERWRAWSRFLPAWRPTGGQLSVVFYGLIGLVVTGAAVVIFNELRAAGVFGVQQSRRTLQRRPAPQPKPAEQTLDAAAIAAAAPHLRPVLLLRALVAALSRSRRLQHERVLTCRELVTAARLDSSAQRELFSRVALLAEGSLYGDPGRPAPMLGDEVLAEASILTRQLLAAPHAQSAST
jgi:hypothetical protein